MNPQQPSDSPFGFTIAARNGTTFKALIFLSGQSLEVEKFRVIVPLRQGDFVPVWRTEKEAGAVLARLRQGPLEAWELKVLDAGPTYCGGGPGWKNRLFRGVDGFVIPEKPGYVFAADLKRLAGEQ